MTIDTRSLRGARMYTKNFLKFYNFFVIYLFNTWVWNCPRLRQLDLYNRYLSDNHVDIGPATGWYLNEARKRYPRPRYALLDLNINSLENSRETLARYSPQLIQADIFEPIPVEQQFSSASANFLIHCLPGPMSHKSIAIGRIADALSDDGVFFGTTLLGKPEKQYPHARFFNWLYNKLGIFSNTDDSVATLTAALEEHFYEVTVEPHWSAAQFVAKKPRRKIS